MPIKCTKNKDRLSSPRLFLRAWASGAALQLVALTALPLERHRGTVCGPPPIQPLSTAHGLWWVPPVCDHSGGGGRTHRLESALSVQRRGRERLVGLLWFSLRGR
ncbi:unnamed protein product [Rangifer tarandus platyrhynchus]|uniref:Uncharacterized protein n=1 Tax=Rangifer tarandus platyrhynchus TaxID=3082113 RepID=A0AC59YQU2_RANTA